MDKNRLMSILKSAVIILAIVCFVSFLRFQAADLSIIPAEQQDMFRDSDGLPYFTEMDSYYNLRMTQDLMSHGHFGSEIRDGVPWDTLSYAPDGRSAEYPPLIAYVTIFLHNVANEFFGDFSLKEVAFYTSAIIAPLAAIPAFIIVRRTTNDYGGAAAALLIALAPNFFSHTFAGFFDTDMFAIVMPLFVVLFFIESIRSSRFVYRIVFAILTILSLVLFSLAWDGYIFYAALLVIFIIIYLILGYVLKIGLIEPRKKYPNIFSWLINQREIFAVVFITLIGFISLGAVIGFDAIIEAIIRLTGLTGLQDVAAGSTAFPNVAISIAELQVPNLLIGGLSGAFLANPGGIINGLGGIVAAFGAFTILVLFAMRFMKLRSIRSSYTNNEKKPPKGERRATSIMKENKEKGSSFIDSAMENVSQLADINRNKRETLLYLTLFSVWILLSAVAVTQGSRFITVLMIPLGLCAGLFVGYAVTYVKDKLKDKNKLMALIIATSLLFIYPIYQTLLIFHPLYEISLTTARIIPLLIFVAIVAISAVLIYGIKGIGKSKFAKTVAMILLLLAIVTPSIAGAYQISTAVFPSTSDPMWDAMLWTKANTTNDSTMASWWDFGYLFQIASERPTLFDGGSQTGIRAFWTGKAMTTNDTELSAGIFTMLAHGGDRPSELLDNYTHDSGKTVEILDNTLALPSEEARDKMINTYNLPPSLADEVVDLTHPDNPQPVIFVASSDMIQKAGWWTYFGNWDFGAQNSKRYTYFASTEPANMTKMSNGKYQANMTNLEDGGIVFKTIATKTGEDNTTNVTTVAEFENGTPVMVNNTTYNPFKINHLLLIEDGFVTKNETINASANYTVFVFGFNGTYNSIIMSKELENAMFTKLFILQGFGQDSYELVHMEPGISLWQIKGVPTLKEGAEPINNQ